MWWLLPTLVWWFGISVASVPESNIKTTIPWICPEIYQQPSVECTCDLPHTLRCIGDKTAIKIIGTKLRNLEFSTTQVSLLDCTIQNVTALPGHLLDGVALHGLVISSGEIREIDSKAFESLAAPLQALGLPNNRLTSIPGHALRILLGLDRLDLSGNQIKSLDGQSFKGLRNISFLELSDNTLSTIAPSTFSELPALKVLRLRSNRLTVQIISTLDPLRSVEELDISENTLLGPLGVKTFPKLPWVRNLQLSHNAFTSIKIGALDGAYKLTSLSLHHNQIDVLEDYAFQHLKLLVTLDLSHNRIVAISGSSLAYLIHLEELDLRHNFLRALTADLILPLRTLTDLRLDDNEISIVSSDALKNTTILRRLTLSDNPLNCDCSLIEFSTWLQNSNLTNEDKESPICTTPPSLENALVANISTQDLLCEEQEDLPLSANPIKGRINLQSINYDGSSVILTWKVDDSAAPFTCDAIFVYEEKDYGEILLESNPLKCNSTNLKGTDSLTIVVPNSHTFDIDKKYRYCLVLLESEAEADDLSLILGCSDVLPLVQNVKVLPIIDTIATKLPKIVEIQAKLTLWGDLNVSVTIYPNLLECDINIVLFDEEGLLEQHKITCRDSKSSFVGLRIGGSYRVCANVIPSQKEMGIASLKPRCVNGIARRNALRSESPPPGLSILDVTFASVFLMLCFIVLGMIWGVRRILSKSKLRTHQCFMPPDIDDEEQTQHNRYVKLQATTNL